MKAPDDLVLLMLALQALFFVFTIVLGFAVKRVLKDIEDNTKETRGVSESLNKLNLSLLTSFVLKEDWHYIRQRVHDLGDAVNAMRAREELREQMSTKSRGD